MTLYEYRVIEVTNCTKCPYHREKDGFSDNCSHPKINGKDFFVPDLIRRFPVWCPLTETMTDDEDILKEVKEMG